MRTGRLSRIVLITFHCSPIDPTEYNPTHKVALRHKEDNDHGHRHEEGNRHHVVDFGSILAVEEIHPERKRIFIAPGEVDERTEEVVPRALKGEDRHREQGRKRKWDKDAPPDLEATGSVNIGRIFQLNREL